MQFGFNAAAKRIYPLIVALIFWGISIVPVFKPNISISTFEINFLGHDKLIEYFNTLRLRLGDRVFPNAIIGNEGWLYYTADRSMDDYQDTNPYSEHELADYQTRFDALYDRLREKNITLVVVIAPDKNTIYPQYLPGQIKKIGGKSRLDQFVDYMNEHGKTPIIDLRAELIKASKTEQVFYKTDTHWNPLGGYIAYTKIMSVLSPRYPELVSHPLSDYEQVHGGLIMHDIPGILGMPQIREDYWAFQPRFEVGTNLRQIPLSDGTFVRLSWNQNQNLPAALIYHDSFLDGVIPFLEPHFRQTTSLFRSDVPELWNINWVDQVHPDIVIIEYVERYLNDDFYIPAN